MHRACPFCLSLLFLASAFATQAARAAESEPLVGRKLSDFSLPDFHGKQRSLSELKDAKAVVVAFIGTECPLARLYAPRLAEVAKEYAARGVAFVAIDANSNDTPTELARL